MRDQDRRGRVSNIKEFVQREIDVRETIIIEFYSGDAMVTFMRSKDNLGCVLQWVSRGIKIWLESKSRKR